MASRRTLSEGWQRLPVSYGSVNILATGRKDLARKARHPADPKFDDLRFRLRRIDSGLDEFIPGQRRFSGKTQFPEG